MTDENVVTSNIGVRASDELRSVQTTAVSSSASMPATPTPNTTDSVDENVKDTMKYGFWQNLINFRENMSKGASTMPMPVPTEGSSDSDEIKPRHSVKSSGSGRRKFGADDDDGDCISELIGHTGLWQFTWSIVLILFQVPPAFHIFAFVFQVRVVEHFIYGLSTRPNEPILHRTPIFGQFENERKKKWKQQLARIYSIECTLKGRDPINVILIVCLYWFMLQRKSIRKPFKSHVKHWFRIGAIRRRAAIARRAGRKSNVKRQHQSEKHDFCMISGDGVRESKLFFLILLLLLFFLFCHWHVAGSTIKM